MSLSNRTLATLAAPFLCLPLAAQSASFTNFGTSCSGSSVPKICKSSNGTATTLQSLVFSQTSEVALEVTGNLGSPLVVGFEILTKARRGKITVPAHIYFADTAGRPLTTAAATGNMVVDTTVAWYRVMFKQPLLVKPGQKFFISWTDTRVPFSQDIDWPVPPTGTKGVSYHRFATSGPFNSGPHTVNPWSWRVLCPGNATMPTLSNTGLPKLGGSYTVNLTQAKGSTVAAMITGLSNTMWGAVTLPFDLTVLGASGCNLYVSFDFIDGVATDASGAASLKISLPNLDALAGAKLHHQWMVVDGGANHLGLAFSGGGTATLGK